MPFLYTMSSSYNLLIVAMSGDEDMMRLLIAAGVDANKQNKDGQTALMFAAWWGGAHGARTMRLLLDAGADANKQEEDGRTAMMIAIKHRNEQNTAEIIHTLVNAGTDINIKDKNNKTAFDIAVEKKNKIAVNILQQYKDNWTFNPKTDIQLQLKLWSEQNIQSVKDITKYWEEHEQSGFGKLPWEIIRDIILPRTIDRKDTVKLIKKKKEEEKKISSRPCKRAKIH